MPVAVPEGGEAVANLTLEPAVTRLDEVVTTATGAVSRREIGNVVASVNADSLTKVAPIRNVNELLQARTSGVQVLQGQGVVGSSSYDPHPRRQLALALQRAADRRGRRARSTTRRSRATSPRACASIASLSARSRADRDGGHHQGSLRRSALRHGGGERRRHHQDEARAVRHHALECLRQRGPLAAARQVPGELPELGPQPQRHHRRRSPPPPCSASCPPSRPASAWWTASRAGTRGRASTRSRSPTGRSAAPASR